VKFMNIDAIKEKLNTNNQVRFKLYSLDYLIEKVDNRYIINAILYPDKKNSYSTIDELLDNYTIFNENIRDNEPRIQNII